MKKLLCICLAFVLILNGCSSKYKTAFTTGLKYLSEGDYEQAVVYFTDAINIDPKKAQAHMYRGVAYVRSRDYDSAVSDFQKAAELDKSVTADEIIEAVVKSLEDNPQDGGNSEDSAQDPLTMEKLYDLLKESGLIDDEPIEDLIGRYIDKNINEGKYKLRVADLDSIKDRISFVKLDYTTYSQKWITTETKSRKMYSYAYYDEEGDQIVTKTTKDGKEILCHYAVQFFLSVNEKNYPKQAQEEYNNNLTVVLEFDYWEDGSVSVEFRRYASFEKVTVDVRNNTVELLDNDIHYYGSFMYGRYLESLPLIEEALSEKGLSLSDFVDVDKFTSIMWVTCISSD